MTFMFAIPLLCVALARVYAAPPPGVQEAYSFVICQSVDLIPDDKLRAKANREKGSYYVATPEEI